MRKSIKSALFLALWFSCLAFGPKLQAATIYDNSVNDLVTRFNPGTLEVGDEIILAGTERYLTSFSFEYWGTASAANFAGNVQVRITFYRNNGAPFNGYATPGSVLWQGTWFSISPTSRNTLFFDQTDFGSLFLPTSDMTWSVQFKGFGTGDAAGVDIYSPVVVGANYPDYWENNGGWTLKNNVVPMNFAARMAAQSVPETLNTLAALLTAVGFLLIARQWQSKH